MKPAFSYMDWVETLGVYYLCHSLNLFLPGQTCMFKSRVRIFGDDTQCVCVCAYVKLQHKIHIFPSFLDVINLLRSQAILD